MKNLNCPGCGRPIDAEDDVVMKTGPMGQEEWHEECAATPIVAEEEVDEILSAIESEVEPVVKPVTEVEPAVEPVAEVEPVVEPETVIQKGKEKKVKKKKEPEVVEADPLAAIMAELQALRNDLNALKSQPPVVEARVVKKGVKGQPRPGVHYVLLGFPSEGFPPQCLRVMKCLAQAAPEGGKMTEVQVWEALMGPETTIGAWHHVQTPFYIFRYYRALMVGADYLKGPFNI